MMRTYMLIGMVCLVCMCVVSIAIWSQAQEPDKDTWYLIQAQNSGKCLDVKDGKVANETKIQQWKCDENNKNQLFKFVPIEDAYYNIEAQKSRKCLNVPDWSKEDGANIQQWDCETRTDANKLFKLVPVGDEGYYNIEAQNSAKCLNVPGWSKENGALIQQWTCENRTDVNKLFKLVPVR